MDSEDDIAPLIDNDSGISSGRDLFRDLNSQTIDDSDFDQVVFGYRKSQWRTVLVYTVSTITCGIPFLLFHWCPTWLLYLTSTRCCFQLADQVLVVETYQKKCKNFYIHKIKEKNIADTSGLLNHGFQDEVSNEKVPIDADVLHTPIRLDDGTTLNVECFRYFGHKKQCLVWGRAARAVVAAGGAWSAAPRARSCTPWPRRRPPVSGECALVAAGGRGARRRVRAAARHGRGAAPPVSGECACEYAAATAGASSGRCGPRRARSGRGWRAWSAAPRARSCTPWPRRRPPVSGECACEYAAATAGRKQWPVWAAPRAQWSRLAGVERGAACAQLHAMAAAPPSSERRWPVWAAPRAQWSRLAGVERGAACAQLHAMAAAPPSSERRVRM
ncbi:hypothetical protein ACJJTC_007503 [Scirpophaga incertulas]